MKVFAIFIALLKLTSVHSVKQHPFKVWEITPESIGTDSFTRIYGGLEAKDGQYPYMIFALMKYSDGTLTRCSASLLNHKWVLLAAHCIKRQVKEPEGIILVGGKADLLKYVIKRSQMNFNDAIDEEAFGVEERRAKEFFSHPEFSLDTLEHDIALIKLDRSFISSSITPISISEEPMKEVKSCTILGWGLTRDNPNNYKLNFVKNKRARTTRLGCKYKPRGPFICLEPSNSGVCQGDSGSPLVCDGKVWGVLSHLVSESEYPSCGDSLEEYYSEIHPDLNWVKSFVNAGSKSFVMNLRSFVICAGASLWVSFNLKF